MDSFPPDAVSTVKELAQYVGQWIRAQASRSIVDANSALRRADGCRLGLEEAGVLDAAGRFQLRDVALTAAAVTLCATFGMAGLEECRADFAAACEPPPPQLSARLWRRVQDFLWAAARLACAQLRGDAAGAQREQHAADRYARHLMGIRRLGTVRLPPESQQKFSSEVARVMPSTVVMLSTCLESSTHAPSPSPRTPYSSAVEGRCTELLMSTLGELRNRSWIELLWAMRRIGSVGRSAERQVPTLSCSRVMDLNSPFGVLNPKPSGRCRALLVGINYAGQEGLQMSVGHKDVADMRNFIRGRGYSDGDMRVLVDDGCHESPSRRAIEAGMSWLVEDARTGDSLFFLYSGHGCTYTGAEGPEEDNAAGDADEALCPADFRSAGMIFDDEIYRLLVRPLREGVHLTCVIDCCQSGTVLHLPYVYSACEERLASATAPSGAPVMEPNSQYDSGKMLQVIQQHPAMCAAAVFWAEELTSMNPGQHRSSLGSKFQRLAQTGNEWASG